jgi:hypothetical protein
VRRNSFSVRVAEPWNKLSRETREARNVQERMEIVGGGEKKSSRKYLQSTAMKI